MKMVLTFQSLLFFCASNIPQSENWRWKIIKITAAQKEKRLDCADVAESNFVYQKNNACYKSYTLKSFQKSDESDNQTLQWGHES